MEFSALDLYPIESTPEQSRVSALDLLRSAERLRSDPEFDAAQARAAEQLMRAASVMTDSLAAQKQLFLLQHLDKIDTHDCAHYPSEGRAVSGDESNPDGHTSVYTQLIALMPKNRRNQDTPPEMAMREYPHTVLRFTFILPYPIPHWQRRYGS